MREHVVLTDLEFNVPIILQRYCLPHLRMAFYGTANRTKSSGQFFF